MSEAPDAPKFLGHAMAPCTDPPNSYAIKRGGVRALVMPHGELFVAVATGSSLKGNRNWRVISLAYPRPQTAADSLDRTLRLVHQEIGEALGVKS